MSSRSDLKRRSHRLFWTVLPNKKNNMKKKNNKMNSDMR